MLAGEKGKRRNFGGGRGRYSPLDDARNRKPSGQRVSQGAERRGGCESRREKGAKSCQYVPLLSAHQANGPKCFWPSNAEQVDRPCSIALSCGSSRSFRTFLTNSTRFSEAFRPNPAAGRTAKPGDRWRRCVYCYGMLTGTIADQQIKWQPN